MKNISKKNNSFEFTKSIDLAKMRPRGFHKKIDFWYVWVLTGKARSQEMSIFEVFEHLKIFKHFNFFVIFLKNLESW